MKPLWLLDVDGVVNAVNSMEDLALLPPEKTWQDYTWGMADGGLVRYPIVWSPSLMARIRALAEAELVEVRWLTTWEERAQSHIAPLLGLPHFELAGHRTFATEGSWWWKLPMAQAAMHAESSQRPLIWTDDDIPSCRAALRWAGERWRINGAESCLVSPHSSLGITPEHMDKIESFIRKHEGRTP